MEVVDSEVVRWKTDEPSAGRRRGRQGSDDVSDAQRVPRNNWPYDLESASRFGVGLLVTVAGAGWALDQDGTRGPRGV